MRRTLFAGMLLLCVGRALGAEPSVTDGVTLASVDFPTPNSAGEPIANHFSAAKARDFMDTAALGWQKRHNCMTCHTNYLYLMVRPLLGPEDDAARTVRQFAEELVTKRWPEKGPRWDAEVVMTALVLALNDAQTTGKLHPISRQALDRIWAVQQQDGGFDWLKCEWPPMESDDEFGATMAALAVSAAPEMYAQTEAAAAGIRKLKSYFAAGNLPTLHHRAMLLWADTLRPGWLSPDERDATQGQLLALQREDGGWSLPSLGDWKRADGTPQDATSSDGYATGLVIMLSRRAGMPASEPRLQRGIQWLKTHQRESGRWFTRSVHQDSKHYITHAGTNMAMMALALCDALDQ